MDGTPANTVQLSALTVTPIPEQHVTLNWKIGNIRRHLYFAERTTDVFTIATLPFEIGGPSLFGNAEKVFFSWRIVHEYITCQYSPHRDPNDPRPPIPRSIVAPAHQWPKRPVVSLQLLAHGDRGLLKGLKTRQLWPDLYIDYSIGVKSRDQEKLGHFKQSQMGLRLRERDDPEKLKLWKCDFFSSKNDLFGYYLNDEDGSLTIELKVSAYLHVTQKTVVHDGGGADLAAVQEFGGEWRLLEKVALLLGDKETSDVVISLDNGITGEIRRFYVHSAILSAQSPVFRAMLKAKDFLIENELKVIKIKPLTLEWAFHQKRAFTDAFDQFLTFLYTGQLREERKKRFDYPDWVTLLPLLANLAVIYDVKDLFEFCDINFPRAAKRYDLSSLLNTAKRLGLNQAEANLGEMLKDLLRD